MRQVIKCVLNLINFPFRLWQDFNGKKFLCFSPFHVNMWKLKGELLSEKRHYTIWKHISVLWYLTVSNYTSLYVFTLLSLHSFRSTIFNFLSYFSVVFIAVLCVNMSFHWRSFSKSTSRLACTAFPHFNISLKQAGGLACWARKTMLGISEFSTNSRQGRKKRIQLRVSNCWIIYIIVIILLSFIHSVDCTMKIRMWIKLSLSKHIRPTVICGAQMKIQ